MAAIQTALDETKWHINIALDMLQSVVEFADQHVDLTAQDAEWLGTSLGKIQRDYLCRFFRRGSPKDVRQPLLDLMTEVGRRDGEPRAYGWTKGASAAHAVQFLISDVMLAFERGFGHGLLEDGWEQHEWNPDTIRQEWIWLRRNLLRLGRFDYPELRAKCFQQFGLAEQIVREKSAELSATASSAKVMPSEDTAATPTPPPSATPGRKRPGRRKADIETEQREAQLVADWKRARDHGGYKPDFAKDHGMTTEEVDALLDRVRKRKRPLE